MLHRLHLTNEPADLALVPGQLTVPRIPLDNGGSKCTRRFDVKQPKPNLRKMTNSKKKHKCLFATCNHPQLPVRIALPEEPHCFLQRHHKMHSIDREGVRKNVNSVWVCFSLFVFDLFVPVFAGCICSFSMIVFWIVARIICVTGVPVFHRVVWFTSTARITTARTSHKRVTLSKSKGNNARIPCNPVWKIKQQRFNFNEVDIT